MSSLGGHKRGREEDDDEQEPHNEDATVTPPPLSPPATPTSSFVAKRRRTDVAEDPRTIAYQLAMELLQSFVQSADGTLSPAAVSSVERIMHHSFSLIAFAKRHAPTPYPASLGVFCILSTEVLLHLFSFLSPRDLCALRPVCRLFLNLSKEPALWRAACYRDFGEATIHNKLHLTLNKTWEWVYQAKAVKLSQRDRILDRQIGHYEDPFEGGCWEGQWKRAAGSIFSRGSPLPNISGYGVYVDGTQTLYEGDFEDGRLHGYGRQLNSLLRFELEYEGEFKHGVWHGKGTCRYVDGCRYEGTWENNLQDGLGTMTYPDTRRYEGEWRRGKRHGAGTLHWPCGTKYVGTWTDDLMAGGGCFTLSDGQTEIRTRTVEEALTVIFARLTPPAPPTSPARRVPAK